MADELIARIDRVKLPPMLDVVEPLISEYLCLIEAVREDEVLLRWADMPRRDNWPEDVSLSVLPEGLLLSIHVGTKEQRISLVQRIEAFLSKATDTSVIFDDA